MSFHIGRADAIIKTNSEVEILREGGKIWQDIRAEITPFVKVGVTGKKIENKVVALFDKYNVKPAFNTTKKFPGIICLSVNDCIVHGLANNTPLKSGDKITLDIGFVHKEFFIDSAFTLLMDQDKHPEYHNLIETTLLALWEAIKALKPNSHVGVISDAIEGYLKKHLDPLKYSIIDGFTGHGIGHNLHETPHIFNKGLSKDEGPILPPNSVICIEPMVLEQENGSFKIGFNGYDVLALTENAKTVHWEHMVLITKKDVEVLTASSEELAKYGK